MASHRTNPQRRQFFKTIGATGLSFSAFSLIGCGNSPNNASAALTLVESEPGRYFYDTDTRLLTLNMPAFEAGDCDFLASIRQYKVRALFHDSLYFKVTNGSERFLQQWQRISESITAEPSIVGTWQDASGHQITFNDDGSLVLGYLGSGCGATGVLGEDALFDNVFRQSVAAGDPSSDGFIIWSRVQTDSSSDMAVTWQVASDHLFTDVVAQGNATARAAQDHTVKHTLTGLKSGSTYYYRFSTPNLKGLNGLPYQSHIGRAKTLPVGDTSQLKIALVSCSSHPHGFFNGYRFVARRDDLDGVYHLGDYIYEYPGNPDGDNPHDYFDQAALDQGRVYRYGNDKEMVLLEDYRLRFRNYREDIDLQLVHTRHSFINTWDDHETTNDSYDPDLSGIEGGAENHNDVAELDEGEWEDRKAFAAQAYNEWLPITDVRSKGQGNYNDPRLDRNFVYGNLAELIVLDTRVQGRDAPPDPNAIDYDETTRKMMSADQRSFMQTRLTNTAAKWKLLGQQVMMGHLVGPPLLGNPATDPLSPWNSVVNPDQWDGFNTERENIFDLIRTQNIDNFIVLTGDIHTSWAINLVDDPRDRIVPPAAGVSILDLVSSTTGLDITASTEKFGVEFVTPSITSPGLEDVDVNGALSTTIDLNNNHIQAANLSERGYAIMTLTPEAARCDWYHLNSILDEEDETETLWRSFATADGDNELTSLA